MSNTPVQGGSCLTHLCTCAGRVMSYTPVHGGSCPTPVQGGSCFTHLCREGHVLPLLGGSCLTCAGSVMSYMSVQGRSYVSESSFVQTLTTVVLFRMDNAWRRKQEQTGFMPPGRPKKWREQCFNVLEQSIAARYVHQV